MSLDRGWGLGLRAGDFLDWLAPLIGTNFRSPPSDTWGPTAIFRGSANATRDAQFESSSFQTLWHFAPADLAGTAARRLAYSWC